MIRIMGIALLVLGSAAQVGQQTPAATEDSDARCLAMFSMAADGSDKEAQEGGRIGAVYFAGKLRGRNPSVDFETVVRRALPAVEAPASPDSERCVAELRAAGTALTTAGAALQRK